MTEAPFDATKIQAAIAASAMIRAAAEALREQMVIDREVAITKRDPRWRAVVRSYPLPHWKS